MLSLFFPTHSPEKRRMDGARGLCATAVFRNGPNEQVFVRRLYFGEATLTRRMSWLPSSID
jgi:hypothetical protein